MADEKKETPSVPAIPGFSGITDVYDKAAAFFADKGYKKRSLGAFAVEHPGTMIEGIFHSIERKGPYSSWLLRVASKDGRQTLSLWANDIIKDQLEGLPFGTEIGIVFKGWVEGRQFNYRDYDIFIGEVPKAKPETPKPELPKP